MKYLKIIIGLLRGIVIFLFHILRYVVIKIIMIVGHEEGMEGALTSRKIRRIRRLTSFKMKIWKRMPHLIIFLDEDDYLKDLERRINYGM